MIYLLVLNIMEEIFGWKRVYWNMKSKKSEQKYFNQAEYESTVKQKVMAIAIIKGVNRKRYAYVISNMRCDHSCGLNIYPTMIEQVHNILNKHEALHKVKQRKSASRYRGRFSNNNNTEKQYGVQYSQDDKAVAGNNSKVNYKITCFECNKKEHYVDQCPSRNESNTKGEQHIQDTTRINENTVKSKNNNMEGGQQHTQTMEVLHDAHSVIMSDNNSSEKLAVDFVFHQNTNVHDNNTIAKKVRKQPSNDILLDLGYSYLVLNNDEVLANIIDINTTLR